jgi:hypothetical protein
MHGLGLAGFVHASCPAYLHARLRAWPTASGLRLSHMPYRLRSSSRPHRPASQGLMDQHLKAS